MKKKSKGTGIKTNIQVGPSGLSDEIQKNASDHADLNISGLTYKGGHGPTVWDEGHHCQVPGITKGY